jgi:hypothetical protein
MGAETGFRTAVPRWFADTEEVTGSNPVAPTIILAGHGVASVERIALATWLGRVGPRAILAAELV